MDNNQLLNRVWVHTDIIAQIAKYLTSAELASFRQVCQLFNHVASDVYFLQPLYNRLYALDNTLSPLLTQGSATPEFTQAFKKIRTRQNEEIVFLNRKHPSEHRVEIEALLALPGDTIEQLEKRNTLLDNININILHSAIAEQPGTELYLNNGGLTRFIVTEHHAEYFKNLTHLYCSYNPLTTLNLQGLTALEELYCPHSSLTTLNLQGLTALVTLKCDNNHLTTLNLQDLTALVTLNCENNHLTIFNLQGLTALVELNCSFNPFLTTLNLQNLTALVKLNCSFNPLTTLNLQGLTVLEELSCTHNSLTTLNLQSLTALVKLHCSFNSLLTTVNLQGLAALVELACCFNPLLTTVNLQGLAAVVKLSCCFDNPLTTLNLQGASPAIQAQLGGLEEKLLFKKLLGAEPQERTAIIERLGDRYTPLNCLKYGSLYKLTRIDSNTAAANQAQSFLPSSFCPTGTPADKPQEHKRKREEDQEGPEHKKHKYS